MSGEHDHNTFLYALKVTAQEGYRSKESKQESSFFEKKEAKKLLFWYSLSSGQFCAAAPIGSVGASGGAAGPKESFLLLFLKKKILASLSMSSPTWADTPQG